ncbi:MAG: M15 family metallopeptidase [Chitinophaga sp.]|uniref:M15 family metallopeptidase n=1 Tax=Chitinophaga sp. TaxID=1869181 RepID=UPI0025BE5CF1|nr:M15 family metallopeptidase [Chitinophaga sp.]MBV8252044.1 M15 family metallopeptidase [Chitinophaga sp.]
MLDLLTDEFGAIAEKVLENCRQQGIIMIPYEKLRTPAIQANYWKTGRQETDIQETRKRLLQENCQFLLACIDNGKPLQRDKQLTNALPGNSWHQWGEAMDCYWLYNGQKIWDINYLDADGRNGYKVYAEEAQKLGLEAGYFWKSFPDGVHIQLRKESSPLASYSLKTINDLMEAYFS